MCDSCAARTALICTLICLVLAFGTKLVFGCERIDPRDVLVQGEWYLILKRLPARTPWEGESLDIWESIPVLEAEISPDHRYWRCANQDGSRKAFLVPAIRLNQ